MLSDDIQIIKASKVHLLQMAELVTKYLGTCHIENSNGDILQRNFDELALTFDCYRLAIDQRGKIVGLCGVGNPTNDNNYGLEIGMHRDVLYVVIEKEYQRQGIGTALLKACLENVRDYPVLYEAWGEIKNGDVNSRQMLEKCSFKLLKDLGTSFYKNHGYCAYCVNRDKNCHACYCKIYIYR